jgi:hypothetical protein
MFLGKYTVVWVEIVSLTSQGDPPRNQIRAVSFVVRANHPKTLDGVEIQHHLSLLENDPAEIDKDAKEYSQTWTPSCRRPRRSTAQVDDDAPKHEP